MSEEYWLYLSVNDADMGDTNPAVGNHKYDANDVVPLEALPEAGHFFINWTGDVADNTDPTTTVTMVQWMKIK
jgi:hypothetical protein